jgi:hypothetical protein
VSARAAATEIEELVTKHGFGVSTLGGGEINKTALSARTTAAHANQLLMSNYNYPIPPINYNIKIK